MSVLSGLDIQDAYSNGSIIINPFDKTQINPNSYNVHLHNEIAEIVDPVIDMKRETKLRYHKINDGGYLLIPGQLYLARTIEYTETRCYRPSLDGRSSIGRLGLFIHITAGYGDVGFKGYWTFELACIKPIRIYAGVAIAQLSYETLLSDFNLYNGKYSRNTDLQKSGLWKEFLKGINE